MAKEGTVGEPLYFSATVKNTKGEGIPGVKAEVVRLHFVPSFLFGLLTLLVFSQWQADGDGIYDVQYPDRPEANDRARIVAEPNGFFSYRGILPTAYPIVSTTRTFKMGCF